MKITPSEMRAAMNAAGALTEFHHSITGQQLIIEGMEITHCEDPEQNGFYVQLWIMPNTFYGCDPSAIDWDAARKEIPNEVHRFVTMPVAMRTIADLMTTHMSDHWVSVGETA